MRFSAAVPARTITAIVAGACAGLVAIGSTAGPAAAANPPPPTRSALRAQAEAIVATGAPGVSAEVRDERGTSRVVAGVGDIATGSAPDPRGPFRAGSITKTFTATVVLQLVGEGRIKLDDPIDGYLPDLLPYRQSITVRDLLQHRSGLFEYGDVVWPGPRAAGERRFHRYTPTQLVRIATKHPLRFTPGSGFFYSNTDYVILGMLVEEVTGHPFTTELRHRILLPAGLRHTRLTGSFPFLRHPALRGYEGLRGTDGPLTDFTTFNMTAAWTSGALVSTASDVNRFYRELLTGDLLAAGQLRQMRRTVHAFPGFGYGLGLAGTEACGQPIWGHVGGAPGYLTYSFTRADGKRQITVTANRSLTAAPDTEEAINGMLMTEFCGHQKPAAESGNSAKSVFP